MCGRYNVTDNLAVRKMMVDLNMPVYQQDKFIFSPDHSPGSTISIIRQVGDELLISDAIWWLMLDPTTLKPNSKYASFNSRSDKLHTPRALAYKPYRESRCIIPATAFIEGLGDGKTYHKIEFPDAAIAFGGIYKTWINPVTGETVLSASIITCPPIPQWATIHPHSCPLILQDQPSLWRDWLNPAITDVSQFESLLTAGIPRQHRVTPIGKVSKWNEIGEAMELPPSSVNEP